MAIFGLRGAGGEQRQTGESNKKGTHFTFWPPGLDCQALTAAPARTVPRSNMPGIRLWFQ